MDKNFSFIEKSFVLENHSCLTCDPYKLKSKSTLSYFIKQKINTPIIE